MILPPQKKNNRLIYMMIEQSGLVVYCYKWHHASSIMPSRYCATCIYLGPGAPCLSPPPHTLCPSQFCLVLFHLLLSLIHCSARLSNIWPPQLACLNPSAQIWLNQFPMLSFICFLVATSAWAILVGVRPLTPQMYNETYVLDLCFCVLFLIWALYI
jgi:hypothetical protein